MSKLSFYKFATLALALLNLGLLVYIVWGKGPRPPHDMKDAAQTEMQLSDEQNKLFLKSAEKHQQAIQVLDQQQARLLQNYFLSESPQNDTLGQDSLLARISAIEKEKIQLTRQHFSEIRGFLKPEQIRGYEAFLKKALGRIFKKGSQMPPPPPRP